MLKQGLKHMNLTEGKPWRVRARKGSTRMTKKTMLSVTKD